MTYQIWNVDTKKFVTEEDHKTVLVLGSTLDAKRTIRRLTDLALLSGREFNFVIVPKPKP